VLQGFLQLRLRALHLLLHLHLLLLCHLISLPSPSCPLSFRYRIMLERTPWPGSYTPTPAHDAPSASTTSQPVCAPKDFILGGCYQP
jgi:hypothetical protein